MSEATASSSRTRKYADSSTQTAFYVHTSTQTDDNGENWSLKPVFVDHSINDSGKAPSSAQGATPEDSTGQLATIEQKVEASATGFGHGGKSVLSRNRAVIRRSTIDSNTAAQMLSSLHPSIMKLDNPPRCEADKDRFATLDSYFIDSVRATRAAMQNKTKDELSVRVRYLGAGDYTALKIDHAYRARRVIDSTFFMLDPSNDLVPPRSTNGRPGDAAEWQDMLKSLPARDTKDESWVNTLQTRSYNLILESDLEAKIAGKPQFSQAHGKRDSWKPRGGGRQAN